MTHKPEAITEPAEERFTCLSLVVIAVYSTIGMAMLVYGLVVLDVGLTVAGIVIVHGGKLWYLDRMVLLFEDTKQRNETFASWEYGA